MEEEDQLLNELKKIEQRKKEREKKTQDLQKLISAAESNIVDARKTDRKQNKKKQQQQQKQTEKNVETLPPCMYLKRTFKVHCTLLFL